MHAQLMNDNPIITDEYVWFEAWKAARRVGHANPTTFEYADNVLKEFRKRFPKDTPEVVKEIPR